MKWFQTKEIVFPRLKEGYYNFEYSASSERVTLRFNN